MKLEAEFLFSEFAISSILAGDCQEILCSFQSPSLFLESFIKVMLRIYFF